VDEAEVKLDFQRLLLLIQAIENARGNNIDTEEANAILAKYKVGDRLSFEDFNKLIHNKAKGKKFF
jgi:uncharacterized coiled-coil DUF342 family protein